MLVRDPNLYLLHIRECCVQLLHCAQLRLEGYVPDSILLDAACRNIEIIGEAAGKIDASFRV